MILLMEKKIENRGLICYNAIKCTQYTKETEWI